jgi:hypothetical protein
MLRFDSVIIELHFWSGRSEGSLPRRKAQWGGGGAVISAHIGACSLHVLKFIGILHTKAYNFMLTFNVLLVTSGECCRLVDVADILA